MSENKVPPQSEDPLDEELKREIEAALGPVDRSSSVEPQKPATVGRLSGEVSTVPLTIDISDTDLLQVVTDAIDQAYKMLSAREAHMALAERRIKIENLDVTTEKSFDPLVALVVGAACRFVVQSVNQQLGRGVDTPMDTFNYLQRLLRDLTTRGQDGNVLNGNALIAVEPAWHAFISAARRLDEAGVIGKQFDREQLRALRSADVITIDVAPSVELSQQLDAIATNIQQRLRQILGERGLLSVSKEMVRWHAWSSHIEDADMNDAPGIIQCYQSVHIPRSRWHSLISKKSLRRKQARTHIERFSGFAYPPDSSDVDESLEKGRTTVIRDDKIIRAFYSTITEPAAVIAHLKRDLRMNPDCPYTAVRQLPETGVPGTGKLHHTGEKITRTISKWNSKEFMLIVFRKALQGELAWSVDIAISPPTSDGLVLRGTEVATALKLKTYCDLPSDHDVIMKVFEITAVNDIPLVPPVWNIRSLGLNQTIGAREVAVVHETWEREDGITLDINWHYLVNPIADARRWAEEHGAP